MRASLFALHETPVQPLGVASVTVQNVRAPRHAFDVPVRFFSEDGMAIGRAVNLSESGALVLFNEAMDVWLTGKLTFEAQEQLVSLTARVVRSDGQETGLSFRPEGEAEQSAIRQLLLLAKASQSAS